MTNNSIKSSIKRETMEEKSIQVEKNPTKPSKI